MNNFLNELWTILVESSFWLIIGFAIAGAVHAIVPREWMLKHLSGGGFLPVAKASLLGIPLPLCSCSVIPVAAGLRSQGASKGASAAFAISTPQTGEESIPITWALFGPVYAITRPIVAVITGLIAGLLIDFTDNKVLVSEVDKDTSSIEDENALSLSIVNADDAGDAVNKIETKSTSVSSCCSSKIPETETSSCCSSNATSTGSTLGEKFKIGFKHGFGTMLIDLAGWLTFGLILAAFIAAVVPQDWIGTHLGTGILPKLIMLLVGIPLYICATSSTPLAWSLVAAGLSPGAALVMLLSGPATNVATMSWLIKDLGIRALIIYLTTIAGVAMVAGILFDAFFTRFVHIADMNMPHDMSSHSLGYKEISAIIFVLLMAWALGMKMRAYMNKKGWGATKSSTSGSCCSSGGCGCSS
ncbi:MAG: SO_0444 family Cu/Zn efflux transporter [Phycisphaerales bacterium]|nr:SO_0444 family Cu/Zn efflux transporter [Phycisphaerales bacterium]